MTELKPCPFCGSEGIVQNHKGLQEQNISRWDVAYEKARRRAIE